MSGISRPAGDTLHLSAGQHAEEGYQRLSRYPA